MGFNYGKGSVLIQKKSPDYSINHNQDYYYIWFIYQNIVSFPRHLPGSKAYGVAAYFPGNIKIMNKDNSFIIWWINAVYNSIKLTIEKYGVEMRKEPV